MEDMTQVCKNELNFLWEISTALANLNDSQTLVNELKDILQTFFGIENFRILIKDESSSTLRDFVKTWIIVEKNFNILKNLTDAGFVLNDKVIKYDEKLEKNFLKNLNEEKNLIYFPVLNEKNIQGVIEVEFNEVKSDIKNTVFLTALRIAMSQISASVVNKMLNHNLKVNIKFQNVMRSIAKLIETQFELNYILPIIGELIDRFISDHLIYIFIRDENDEFKLFWPLDCQDERVFALISKMKEGKSCLISKDGKAGLWAIRNDEETVGLIAASSNMDKLSKTEVDYLSQLTQQTSVTTQRANAYAEVLKFATLDALTGLNNRRQFEVRLKQETANARRNKKSLCCIMLDIDYFKKVNDTWGHSAGDRVLKRAAKIIVQELREYDIASRYGGEEFCILLPDTKLQEAVFVAQRLRKAVEKADINIAEDQALSVDVLKVTISIGVSQFDETCDVPERLHQMADIALYEAKHRGRNRVVVYEESLG